MRRVSQIQCRFKHVLKLLPSATHKVNKPVVLEEFGVTGLGKSFPSCQWYTNMNALQKTKLTYTLLG